MPRPRRNYLDRSCYHITHRCHRGENLLKFAKHRRLYYDMLRETLNRFRIDILDYVVTSNHVHLLVWARHGEEISQAVQFLHGRAGQVYNKMKDRNGAFWTDRHHATLVQTGRHLSRCLFYIDFNMIRARAVDHPAEWDIAGCRELLGLRQRYRVINRERLLSCFAMPDWDHFSDWYCRTLEEQLVRQYHVREPFWSEALAVGDPEWLESVADRVSTRKRKAIFEVESPAVSGMAEDDSVHYLAAPSRDATGRTV